MSDLAAARAHRSPRGRGPTSRPSSWWGMLIVIATEGTLFTVFIGTYYYLRFNAVSWPPDGDPKPALVTPVVLTLVLAATSVPMQLAWQAAQARRVGATRALLSIALVVQCGYLAYQLHDLRDKLRNVAFTRDAYTSITDTLLVADHAHVALGILFILWLLAKLRRGLTTYRLHAVQAISWYWHFVNVATLLVTCTLLSGRT
jgi:cytochrome c oxidase subunit 3